MKLNGYFKTGLVIATLALASILSGCLGGLTPEISYQGLLTDENGNPLSGLIKLTFRLFHQDTGGTHIYQETENVTVDKGLFNTIVGPSTVVAGLTPEDLSQPLWLEVIVGNGTYTETLTPRQRLYGSPYAFTLMPGAVISSTMDTNTWGGAIHGVLNVVNMYDAGAGDPALASLRVVGEGGLELAEPPGQGDDGNIFSDRSEPSSDLFLFSNDEIWLYLDDQDTQSSEFRVIAGDNTAAFRVNEDGDTHALGDTSAGGVKSAVVQTGEEMRHMYSIESTEVWFEDFGTGKVTNGRAVVSIDSLFAQTVNLSEDYHIFLTPLGDSNGLYVLNKTGKSFEVRESGGGTSSISFDYRIVARRTGYEDLRMELDTSSKAVEGGDE